MIIGTTKHMQELIEYLKLHNLHDWAATATITMENGLVTASDLCAFTKRAEEAEAANEMDRSRIPVALTELNAAIRGREWVLDGRGAYVWYDGDYREEFRLWVRDVRKASTLFARIAADWHGCPTGMADIRHARDMIEEAKPEVDAAYRRLESAAKAIDTGRSIHNERLPNGADPLNGGAWDELRAALNALPCR